MMRRFLVRALLAVGISVNIAFLAINFSPERPHLRTRHNATVLVAMRPQEARWLEENELAEWGAQHDLSIKVEALPNAEAVVERLRAEKEKPTGVLLADLSDDVADDARRSGLIRPITEQATPAQLAQINAAFLPEALKRAHIDTPTLWMLPSRAAVDTVVYMRPAVEAAYLHWDDDRPAIEALLKAVNGVGLPAHYSLKRSPDDWDSFDLFVAAYYWSHHTAPWAGDDAGAIRGRIAIRGGTDDDAMRDLMARFYQHGATDAQISKFESDIPPVIDAFQWQSLWRRSGLTRRGQSGHGVSAEEILGLMLQRQIAWSPMSAELSFRVHGGSRPDVPPGMPEPSDLGWALMPRGVSVELGADGGPARQGQSYSFQEIRFWAAPVHADPKQAFSLARFATQAGLQQREAEALGSLPVRTEIRDTYPILFRLAWMQQVFGASFRQIEAGSGDMPGEVSDQHLDVRYKALRRAAVFEADGGSSPAPTYDVIRQRVKEAAHGH